jgi:Mrp family chromosome partitioning ATPase
LLSPLLPGSDARCGRGPPAESDGADDDGSIEDGTRAQEMAGNPGGSEGSGDSTSGSGCGRGTDDSRANSASSRSLRRRSFRALWFLPVTAPIEKGPSSDDDEERDWPSFKGEPESDRFMMTMDAAAGRRRKSATRNKSMQKMATSTPPRLVRSRGDTGISKVAQVLLVSSCKGGVGKSTVSANLAVLLARLGLQTGLLDADLSGPSIPRMLGLPSSLPPTILPSGRFSPLRNHGVSTMSMGNLIPDTAPVAWRGPMAMKGITDLLLNTEWGSLDVLVIDMPPGTGDLHLSLAQEVGPVSAAVVVTTPQMVAVEDAVRGARLFETMRIPVLGVVENMSYFVCRGCEVKHEIYGRGEGEGLAERFRAPVLARIPIEVEVGRGGERGVPAGIVVAPRGAGAKEALQDPVLTPAQKAFGDLASTVKRLLEEQKKSKPPAPEIKVE